jgi:hypothetical protein
MLRNEGGLPHPIMNRPVHIGLYQLAPISCDGSFQEIAGSDKVSIFMIDHPCPSEREQSGDEESQ